MKDHCKLALILAALSAPASTVADDYSDGTFAFEAGDYRTAAFLWSKAAHDGSALAKFRIGELVERGLGMPRDPVLAFHFYLAAAQQGLPEAAVNVGIMFEEGVGVTHDSVAAGIWYARAAAAGNDRAAFRLGIMYQDGNGVPINGDLASYWLGMALDAHPALTNGLERPRVAGSDKLSAPIPLAAFVLREADHSIADLIWTATPGPETSRFVVQVLSSVGSDQHDLEVRTEETAGSALRVRVPESDVLWRVARVDPVLGEYRASHWQRQISGQMPDPRGLVTIVVNQGDARAADVAQELALALRPAGLIIGISTSKNRVKVSAIVYRYSQDAGYARDLAGFLPGFNSEMVTQYQELAAGPGNVVVNLVIARDEHISR